jgi:hypothetical protein
MSSVQEGEESKVSEQQKVSESNFEPHLNGGEEGHEISASANDIQPPVGTKDYAEVMPSKRSRDEESSEAVGDSAENGDGPVESAKRARNEEEEAATNEFSSGEKGPQNETECTTEGNKVQTQENVDAEGQESNQGGEHESRPELIHSNGGAEAAATDGTSAEGPPTYPDTAPTVCYCFWS